jgi:hypothetical protein
VFAIGYDSDNPARLVRYPVKSGASSGAVSVTDGTGPHATKILTFHD